jgi:hypothetical protein
MTKGQTTRYRGSLAASAIGLPVLTFMALLGLYSVSTGRYAIPAALFLLFLAVCAVVLVYTSVAEVDLSAEGIFQKTLFCRWRFRWDEIRSWTVRMRPNDSDELLFRVRSSARVLQVTGAAVNEKEMRDVKMRFQEYVGDATAYDAFMAPCGQDRHAGND